MPSRSVKHIVHHNTWNNTWSFLKSDNSSLMPDIVKTTLLHGRQSHNIVWSPFQSMRTYPIIHARLTAFTQKHILIKNIKNKKPCIIVPHINTPMCIQASFSCTKYHEYGEQNLTRNRWILHLYIDILYSLMYVTEGVLF